MKDTQGNQRIDFASARGVEVPDFLDIQVESFKEFFQLDTLPEDRKKEGLYKTFQEKFPNYRFQKPICFGIFRLYDRFSSLFYR